MWIYDGLNYNQQGNKTLKFLFFKRFPNENRLPLPKGHPVYYYVVSKNCLGHVTFHDTRWANYYEILRRRWIFLNFLGHSVCKSFKWFLTEITIYHIWKKQQTFRSNSLIIYNTKAILWQKNQGCNPQTDILASKVTWTHWKLFLGPPKLFAQ